MLRELSHDKQTSVEARLASDTNQRLRMWPGSSITMIPNEVPRFDVNHKRMRHFSSTPRRPSVARRLPI